MRYIEYATIYGTTTAQEFSQREGCTIEQAVKILDEAVEKQEAKVDMKRGVKTYYSMIRRRTW